MAVAAGARSSQREDIQGLRGLAVLLVVLYHAGVPGVSGGFTGVDIFFVLSGFLITGLLVREVQANGRVDYWRFIARRARRLLPAALLVTAAVSGGALIVYPAVERTDVLSAARAAVVYASNLWFAGRAVDYLGGDAASNPILHMWSLAVEEQFYVVWPWVIALAASISHRARSHRPTLVIVTVLSGLSLLACVWMTLASQPWAFFGTPFRAWEFGLGAIVRLADGRLRAMPDAGSRALGLGGLATVAMGVGLIDDHTTFPGAWALLPAGGTALLLASLEGNGVDALRKALAWSPLARLGDLSYSWYLWHWPFLVMTPVWLQADGPWVTAGAVLASLLAAAMSYHLVEQPLRHRIAVSASSSVVAGVALGCTVAAAVVLSLLKLQAASEPAGSVQSLIAGARRDLPTVFGRGCHIGVPETTPTECVDGDTQAARSMVLFGDSHAAHWHPALVEVARSGGWRLVSLTKSACPAADVPVRLESHRRSYHECALWRAEAMRRIAELKPEIVVMASSSRYTGVTPEDWATGTRRTVKTLEQSGAAVAIVRDTPWPGFGVPVCLARAEHRGRPLDRSCVLDLEKATKAGVAAFEIESRIAADSSNVRIIDLTSRICPADRCAVYADGIVHFSDNNHLSASFAKRLAAPFRDALLAQRP